jgi:dipeptidyl aminopeptidase/acylaminoacyl peptidase
VRSYDLAAGRLVYAATDVANPNELYTSAADGSGERRLTELNSGWLADREIVHPTEGWIERADETRGTRVQYWTMAPAGLEAGAKHPLVLAIHGGPSAMWGPGEHTMWHEFQLLAARGYGIVYANPRGSGGYGYDFKKANYQDWGAGPAGDLLAALDEAAKLPWVDPEKRFVVGGSYAGYMTAWIVGHDQRFDAAVAQRGVYDLSFFFGEGNAWRLVPYHMGGYPWEPEARAVLDRESPLTYVDEIRTPLLIIHSDRDRRTGVNQSEMLYKALKVLERPVEYVRYPEEGHDLSRSGDPKRRLDRLNRIVEFFERYR